MATSTAQVSKLGRASGRANLAVVELQAELRVFGVLEVEEEGAEAGAVLLRDAIVGVEERVLHTVRHLAERLGTLACRQRRCGERLLEHSTALGALVLVAQLAARARAWRPALSNALATLLCGEWGMGTVKDIRTAAYQWRRLLLLRVSL